MNRSFSDTSVKEEVVAEESSEPQSGNNRNGHKPGQYPGHIDQSIDSSPPIFLFRIIVVGDSNVGKSVLIGNLTNQPYIHSQKHRHTIGFKTTSYPVHGYAIKAEFWDTPGDAKYRQETARLCSTLATAFVIVFSLKSLESYQSIHQLVDSYDLVRENDGQFRRPTLLIGTRLDEIHESGPSNIQTGLKLLNSDIVTEIDSTNRQVQYDEAHSWANERGGDYSEVCATRISDPTTFPNFMKKITNHLPNGIQSDPQTLVDSCVYPIMPLPPGKQIEYKNMMAWTRRIDDCADSIDWL